MIGEDSQNVAKLREISPNLERSVQVLGECGHPMGETLAQYVKAHQGKVEAYDRSKQNFIRERQQRPTAPLNDLQTYHENRGHKSAVMESVRVMHGVMSASADVALSHVSHYAHPKVQKCLEDGGGYVGLTNFRHQYVKDLETVNAYWEEINADIPYNLRRDMEKELETEWLFHVRDAEFTQDPDKDFEEMQFEADAFAEEQREISREEDADFQMMMHELGHGGR